MRLLFWEVAGWGASYLEDSLLEVEKDGFGSRSNRKFFFLFLPFTLVIGDFFQYISYGFLHKIL